MDSLPSLAASAVAMASLLAWLAAGRHVVIPTHPPATTVGLPMALATGWGLWLALWLAVVPLGGGDTPVAAVLYLLLVLALAAHNLRQWARNKPVEHHLFTLLAGHALLASPWLAALGQHVLATPADLDVLTAASLWPHSQTPLPPAWMVLLRGISPLGEPAHPLLAGLLGLLVPAMLAALLVEAAHVRVRWSNLLWVAVPSLAAATAYAVASGSLPPLGTGIMPPLLPAVLVLMLSLPLLRANLPLGMQALPYGLAAGVLALAHPWGLPAALALAASWLLCGSLRHGPTPPLLLAASWLACLPLLAMAGWLAVAPPAQAVCAMQPLQLPSCLAPWWGGVSLGHIHKALLVCLLVWSLLATHQTWRRGKTHVLWVWMPAGLTILAAAPWPDVIPSLAVLLAPLLLVPLVWWLMGWYASSALHRTAFRMPWQLGLMAGIPLFAAFTASSGLILPAANPLAGHGRMIASDIRAKALPAMPLLAAVGLPDSISAVVGYQLAPHVRLWADIPEPANLAELHSQLNHARIHWALLGPAVALRAFNLPPPLAANLLVESTADAILIRAVFPLPAGLAPTAKSR